MFRSRNIHKLCRACFKREDADSRPIYGRQKLVHAYRRTRNRRKTTTWKTPKVAKPTRKKDRNE